VDVVIGPTFGPTEGLVLREVARRHPDVAFVLSTAGAQETTLRNPAPNVFRFVPDDAQQAAGLGGHAYHDLGWRKATVVLHDTVYGWPQAAGFVAEFCALGGQVTRLTTPFFTPITPDLAMKVPADVDGVALISASFQETLGFAAAYAKRRPELARHLVLGPAAFSFADPKVFSQARTLLGGLVTGLTAPEEATNPEWKRFRTEYVRRFPGLHPPLAPADFPIVLAYYDAMTAVAQALERVDGDLSGGLSPFLKALAKVELDSPSGPIRLDGNRQAIALNYLSRVELDAKGKPALRTMRVVPNVEQTFGGYFTGKTPPPSTASPACHKATPPPWARSA
jgi:branched-chain amino acid transport system substrate-binding protein